MGEKEMTKPLGGKLVAIIPAAGSAERFGRIPKMLLPLPQDEGGSLLRRLCLQLLEAVDEVVVPTSRSLRALLAAHLEDLPINVHSLESLNLSSTLFQMARSSDDKFIIAFPDVFYSNGEFFKHLSRRNLVSNELILVTFFTPANLVGKVGHVTSLHGQIAVRDKAKLLPGMATRSHWGALYGEFVQLAKLDPNSEDLDEWLNSQDLTAVESRAEYWDVGTFDLYLDLLRNRLML